VVLYNTTGKNIASCVLDKQSFPDVPLTPMVSVKPKGFIAEKKTIFNDTDDEIEAHYLCAVLNSDVVNEAIKPLQTRGLFGERDIVRRPLMLPIPRFDPGDPTHVRLAELSEACHVKVRGLKLGAGGAATRRRKVRAALKRELDEINRLVKSIV